MKSFQYARTEVRLGSRHTLEASLQHTEPKTGSTFVHSLTSAVALFPTFGFGKKKDPDRSVEENMVASNLVLCALAKSISMCAQRREQKLFWGATSCISWTTT